MSVASPCINVCRMHDGLGLCEGCARSLDEIASWSLLDDAAKAQVLKTLPARQIILRRAGVPEPQMGRRS